MRAFTLGCLALACGCARAADAPPVAAPALAPPPRAFSQSCPLRLPDDAATHASVPEVPRAVLDRSLAPVLLAVCACVHPGDEVSLVVRMLPNEGEVRAGAPDDAAVDACLSERLSPGHFEAIAFEEPGPCTSCGAERAPSHAVHAPPSDVLRPGRPHVAISVPLVLVRP